jgi:hypothetical protein
MTAPEHDDLGACPLFAGLAAAELAAVLVFAGPPFKAATRAGYGRPT